MKKIVLGLFKTESKKGTRIPLFLITVAITCITLFASMNVVGLLYDSMEYDIRASKVGNSDFIMYEKNYNFYKKHDLGEENPSLDVFNTNGLLKNNQLEYKCNFMGVDLSKYQDVFAEIEGLNGDLISDIDTNKIVISEKVSEEINVKRGDNILLEIGGISKEFNIILVDSNNTFLNSSDNMVLISGKELKNILNIDDEYVTTQYIYNTKSTKEEIESIISNDKIIVENSINEDIINSGLKSYYGILSIIFTIILISCYDILESANRIFIIERSNFIGALRSMGTTKKQIKKIFGLYSLFIGVIGSVIGVILGEVCLWGYNRIFLGGDKLNQSLSTFIITAVITIALSIIIMLYSVFSPLKEMLKKSDRDILLNANSVYIDNSLKKVHFISAILLAVIIIVSNISNIRNPGFWLIGLIIAFIAVLNTIKFIYWFINRVTSIKPKKGVFIIAIKNILNNFFVRKTISTTISISLFILLICTLSISTINGLSSFYNDYNADAYLRAEEYFSEKDMESIKSLDSVDKYLFYSTSTLNYNKSKKIQIISIDNPILLEEEFINLRIEWLDGFDASTFNLGYNIVTTKILAEKYDLNLGDEVECSDAQVEQNYRIVGIADTLFELGDISYISRYQMNFKDFKEYNGVYLIANKDKSVENELSAKLKGQNYRYTSVEEMVDRDQKNSSKLFTLLYAFSIFIALTNLVGMYSNYKLSYLFRSKEMATMYSYGYDNTTIIRMVIYEIVFSSILGFVFSLGSTAILVKILENLMKVIDIPLKLVISKEIVVLLFGLIVFIAVINLSLAIKHINNSRKNLIVNLKS